MKYTTNKYKKNRAKGNKRYCQYEFITVLLPILILLSPCKGLAQTQTGIQGCKQLGQTGLNISNDGKNGLQFDFQILCDNKYSPRLKGCNINTVKPDSIYEFKKYGYFTQNRRWQFTYHDNGNLSTKYCYYYKSNNNSELITERWIYNTNGELTLYAKHMPCTYTFNLLNDSLAYDILTKKITYENGNMTYQIVIDSSVIAYTSWFSYYENNYYYNIKDQLTRNSYHIFSTASTLTKNLYTDTIFTYNPNGETEYVITPKRQYGTYYIYEGEDTLYSSVTTQDTTSISVIKYEYEYTDSTKLTSVNSIGIKKHSNREMLDTITIWENSDYYYETYDDNGRRKSLLVTHNSDSDGESIDYLAEFSYTENDQLLLAYYYSWEGTADSGNWVQTMIIENTYDDDGKILTYEKKYYYDQLGIWDTNEMKTYYYPENKSIETTETNSGKEFGIYPNPATDYLKLTGITDTEIYYSVYDLTGKILLKESTQTGRIDINLLQRGLYLLKIDNDKSTQVIRFTKE